MFDLQAGDSESRLHEVDEIRTLHRQAEARVDQSSAIRTYLDMMQMELFDFLAMTSAQTRQAKGEGKGVNRKSANSAPRLGPQAGCHLSVGRKEISCGTDFS